jgi:DNA-binding response OmpR family regulator
MNEEKKIILIAEDEPSLLGAISEKISQEGFSVIKTSNGEECLKEAIEKKPDLILLDIIMPKMDGIMVLKKLREDKWGKTVPVIMLTNLSSAGDVQKAMEYGAYDYLVKSDWSLDDLMKKVKERLG